MTDEVKYAEPSSTARRICPPLMELCLDVISDKLERFAPLEQLPETLVLLLLGMTLRKGARTRQMTCSALYP